MFQIMDRVIKGTIDLVKDSGGRAVGSVIAAIGAGSKSISEHLGSQEVNQYVLLKSV